MNNDVPENERLSAYLDGELTAQEQAEVEQLLAASPAARQLLDDLRALSGTLQSLPQHRLAEDLSQRVLRQAERQMLTEPALTERPVPRGFAWWSVVRRFTQPRALVWTGVTVAVAILLMLNERAGQRQAAPRQLARAPEAAPEAPHEPPQIRARREEGIGGRGPAEAQVQAQPAPAADEARLSKDALANRGTEAVTLEHPSDPLSGPGAMGKLGAAPPSLAPTVPAAGPASAAFGRMDDAKQHDRPKMESAQKALPRVQLAEPEKRNEPDRSLKEQAPAPQPKYMAARKSAAQTSPEPTPPASPAAPGDKPEQLARSRKAESPAVVDLKSSPASRMGGGGFGGAAPAPPAAASAAEGRRKPALTPGQVPVAQQFEHAGTPLLRIDCYVSAPAAERQELEKLLARTKIVRRAPASGWQWGDGALAQDKPAGSAEGKDASGADPRRSAVAAQGQEMAEAYVAAGERAAKLLYAEATLSQIQAALAELRAQPADVLTVAVPSTLSVSKALALPALSDADQAGAKQQDEGLALKRPMRSNAESPRPVPVRKGAVESLYRVVFVVHILQPDAMTTRARVAADKAAEKPPAAAAAPALPAKPAH